MFISKAYAQAVEIGSDVASQVPAEAPSIWDGFMWNMGMVLILVVMFYALIIWPQQKRFKEHSAMLSSLKKGDEVITSGGLIGKIEKIKDEDDEVTVNLGDMKVKAMKNTLSLRHASSVPLTDKDKKSDSGKKAKKK